ncbi:MAG: glutaredoxin family protein [Nitrospinota bacterium]
MLYSKEDCHLCEIAKADLRPVCERYGVAVREVDITRDPDLLARHGKEVPVGYLNGEKVFKLRVEPRRLRRLLKRAAREACHPPGGYPSPSGWIKRRLKGEADSARGD